MVLSHPDPLVCHPLPVPCTRDQPGHVHPNLDLHLLSAGRTQHRERCACTREHPEGKEGTTGLAQDLSLREALCQANAFPAPSSQTSW